MIKLYSTNCPKCKVVELKLKQKNVDFELITNVDKVVEIGNKNNITSAPILEADGKYLDFTSAVKYINEIV